MANIKQYLDNILNAIFGKDVRQSIHDGIDAINKEVINSNDLSNTTKARQDVLERKYDEQIKNIASSEPQNAEIVDARNGFDTLGSIIKQKIYHFSNVEAMKKCLTLSAGDVCQTAGYYQAMDGGAGTYLIVHSTSVEEDGGLIHILKNGFQAKLLIKDNTINILQCGAKKDNSEDCSGIINTFMTLSYKLYMPEGNYLLNKTINMSNNNLKCDGTISYTGKEYAFKIAKAQSNLILNKLICKNGCGILLESSNNTLTTYNTIKINNLEALNECIMLNSLAYGIQYNFIYFTKLTSSNSDSFPVHVKRDGGWIGENQIYGGVLDHGLYGIYAESNNPGSITGLKIFNVGFEGVTNGCYLKNVSTCFLSNPRYGEVQQSGNVLVVEEQTIDLRLDGESPIYWNKIQANNKTGRACYINAPIFSTGGSVIAHNARINNRGLIFKEMYVSYTNVLKSETTISKDIHQPTYFYPTYGGTAEVTLNENYHYDNINEIYIDQTLISSSLVNIKDYDGNLIFEGSNYIKKLVKLKAYNRAGNNSWIVEEL